VSMLVLLTPADAKKQFEIRADAVRNELTKLEAEKRAAGDLPRLFLLEDAYRIALLNAEFVWLQAAIADFSNGSLNWNEKWLRDIAAKFTPNDQ
jgi:hypothetical protein